MGGGGGLLGGIVGAVIGVVMAPATAGASLLWGAAGLAAGTAVGTTAEAMLTKQKQPEVYGGKSAADAEREAETARENAATAEAARLRKRRGAASTIVSGINGPQEATTTLKQTLGGA